MYQFVSILNDPNRSLHRGLKPSA